MYEVVNKIKKLMELNNVNQTDLIRAVFKIQETQEIPHRYRVRISDYFKLKAKIPIDVLKDIAKYFNVSITYFLEDDEKIPITRHLPIIGRASCGIPTNHFYQDSEHEMFPVSEDMYRKSRYLVYAEGDSMEPKIRNGDLVLCDVDLHINNGDIVHYNMGEESGIKRAKMDVNGKITYLTPTNDAYEIIPVTEELRVAKCLKVTSNLC